MKLFVSALEYSANVHLCEVLREIVKCGESVELCGIFDEKMVGNSVLGMQFRTCENFGESTDSSLVLSPKFSQIQKPHRNHFDCDLLRKSTTNRAKIAESSTFSINGTSLCDTNSIAVMGFIDVLKKAKFFLDLRKKCLNLALTADKILLMDSSSFNIPLAKRIKKRDKTKQIIYYILPQVWAWKPWRARAIEANCDRLAAILPFEVGFYKNKAKFVGHPLLDEIKAFRVGNSPLGLHSADFANLGHCADFSLALRPKFAKNHESQTENPSVVDSAQSAQNLGENNPRVSANLESRPLRGAKNREQGCSSATADFLLEADKRGSPPKSEKAAAFWRVGGAGRGVQPFLREESSENGSEEIAESRLDSVDSAILSQSGLPRSHTLARNDDSFRDSAVDCNADSANQAQIAESSNIFSFMPGSRTSEIKRIFPIFTEVKDALKSRDKDAKFHLIIPQKFTSQNLAQIYGDVSDFHISFDAHRSLFQSRFAFICSGTATLECALIGTPFVLGYKCRALEAFVARCFLNVKFIGLANILYEKISPNKTFHTELIQGDLSAQNLLSALDSANENDFLQKSLALRKYLKCGSASAVAKMLYGL